MVEMSELLHNGDFDFNMLYQFVAELPCIWMIKITKLKLRKGLVEKERLHTFSLKLSIF